MAPSLSYGRHTLAVARSSDFSLWNWSVSDVRQVGVPPFALRGNNAYGPHRAVFHAIPGGCQLVCRDAPFRDRSQVSVIIVLSKTAAMSCACRVEMVRTPPLRSSIFTAGPSVRMTAYRPPSA